MRRDTLLARVAEDYGVDLADYQVNDEEKIQLDEASVAKEIDELRDKLARLGSVNSEAVAELDDLEKRSATFELQINDLNVAQKHLETLIGKINEECRRLFVDTFETIRTHFQELFRKLFGGGKADIVLEDENDVLESGLEIVARPPGKEPQSISLLSGGEKTMTAVALVMAIFRSKPSPFCILDEVDAALDEANIGRFMQMVREYTNLSQFIIITHSKTTMANADVLHGITQRESGVSIRVSVRLEDVTEDGHIIDREENDTSAA
jgi:chromosome segregation protein